MSSPRTLASVIVYIRVVRVVLDSLLEALESFLRVTLLHPYARDLDPRLRQTRLELERVEEVRLGAVDVCHEELECPAQIQGLRAPVVPRDALLERLVHERVRMRVVRRAERFERGGKRAVARPGHGRELRQRSCGAS